MPNTCTPKNPVDFGTLYPADFVGSPGSNGIADPPDNHININDLNALKFYSEGKPYKTDYNLDGNSDDANDMDISFLNSFFDLNGDGKVDFEDNKGDKQTLKDIIVTFKQPKGDDYPGLTPPYVRKGLRTSSERLTLNPTGKQFDATIHLQLDETQEFDGVETHFTFDPNILQVNRITLKNQFDEVILNDFDNTQGSIDFLGIQTGKTNLKGGFDLMTVNFTWLDQTREPILQFEPDQIITVFKGSNIPHMVSVNFNQTVSLLTGKVKPQVPSDPYRKTDLLIHLDADPKMYNAQTDSEGIFTVELPSGTHDVYVTRSNTLQNKVKVTIGENTEVIDFGTLYGGDVIGSGPPNMKSANNRIDVYDFWALQAFEKELTVPPLDYNLDGIFDEKTDLDTTFLNTLFDIDNDGIVVGEKEYVAMVNSLRALPAGGADSLPPLEAKRPASATPQMQQLPLEVSHLLAGQTFDILVKMQPTEDMMKVEGAEVHLNFDPSLLQVESITDGKNFDKVPLNHFNNSTGNIDFLTVAFNNIIPQGTFDLMTIHFKLLAQGGNPTLTFDQNQLKAVFRGRAVEVNLLAELNEAEPPPLVVTSSSFIAIPENNGILLSWETDPIIQGAGFNLFRSEKNTHQPVQLNVSLIPTQSESTVYTFLDNTILPGIIYDYTLEELEMDGQSSQYGPISFVLIRSPEDNSFFTLETVPTFAWIGESEEVFTLQYTYENEQAVHEISTRGTIFKPTVEEWQTFANQAKGRVISWHVRDAQGNFSETRRFTVTE